MNKKHLHFHERGGILIIVLLYIAAVAMLAAVFAVHVTTEINSSKYSLVAIQNDLLAFSAEEEARM